MQLEISDIINKHKGQPALVMGLSSSLNPYIDNMKDYKDYVKISCNHWYQVPDMQCDYWVLSNSEDTIKNLYKEINIKDIPVFYAESVDDTPRDFVDQNIEVDYLAFDERHFNDEAYHKTLCKIGNCCDRIIPGRLTIQEELAKLSNYREMNRMVCTIAEHMISFALLFGCNPIHIAGVDLDYSKGYVRGIEKHNKGGGFKPHLHIIKDNIRILKKHAERLGIEVIF